MPISRRRFIQAAGALVLPWDRLFAADEDSSMLCVGEALPLGELQPLLTSFANPPHADKPGGYWWWFNTLMNREGTARDLSEFKAKGISEVLLVNSAAGLGGNPIPSGPPFLSEGWFDLYRFALEQAHKHGITMGFNLCAGWCMGGPWIKPEESGRWFLQSKHAVTGPSTFDGKLPLPGNRDGYVNVKNPPGINDYIDLPLEALDYRDTAVIAVKLPGAGSAELAPPRRDLLYAKTNRMDASNWTRATVIMEKPLKPWPNDPADAPIAADSIVDLTSQMQADGHLQWDVPEGNWVIIRTGHRMTGSTTMLGLPGAEGLSVDWLNRRGMDSQWEHLGKRILEASKPYVGNTLAYLCDDSFEDGFPNWTDNIIEQFRKYRGYDPTPYLAVLAGYLVESAAVSDRFLHDYRKTVADLLADEHYTRFRDLCHGSGLKVQNESAGPSRSGTMCMDGLKNLGRSDMPMGEFWLGLKYGEPNNEDPKMGYRDSRLEDGQNKVCKMVASGAHIYGKNLVSAEAFTSFRPHWIDYPATLRYAADRAFCEGVNRIMIHTVTGSRPEDGKPGYEYGAGTHFNPNVTWWDQSGAFLTYLARCQHLLRKGLFVADVLYYNGDWAPNLVEAKHTDPSLGRGYDYDVCNEEVLLTRLSVKDGRLVLPDGMSYRMLVLPETDKMPVPVARKLQELVKAGALILGPKPAVDPGLKNYPACDAELKLVADELWDKGQIHSGITQRDLLKKHKVEPDFLCDDPAVSIDFIHRRDEAGDSYFVLNRTRQPQKVSCRFRVTRHQPYLLDPVTGEGRALTSFETSNYHTIIPLEFDSQGSYFVVFPAGTQADATGEPNFQKLSPVLTIEGPWKVAFDPKWGGPESVEFPALADWSTHSDTRIKHYSGAATYTKVFEGPAKPGKKVFLNLGTVHSIADVRLNGTDLGTVWTPPWQVDISEQIKPGTNELQIKVTNLWPNRLIGDAALPVDQRLTKTNIDFKPTDPLLPSGLLGPVLLLTAAR